MPELKILSREQRAAFAAAVSKGQIRQRIPSSADDPLLIAGLHAQAYLEICRECYAAVRPYQRRRPVRRLYHDWADGRDAGLTRLPARSVRAFRDWLWGNAHAGSHPFEIWRNTVRLVVHGARYDRVPAYWLSLHSVPRSKIEPNLIRIAMRLKSVSIPFSLENCRVLAGFAVGGDWVAVADDHVWEIGEPVWPCSMGISHATCSFTVSELVCHPALMRRVEWISNRTTVIPYDDGRRSNECTRQHRK